jgi:sugar phosphate isomerase/epimerase
MKIGFFGTGTMGKLDLPAFALWGKENGFGEINVPWNRDDARAIADQAGLDIWSTYGQAAQPISADEREREAQIAQGKQALNIAAQQGIPTVQFGHRRDSTVSARENIGLFQLGFEPLARHAESVGVKIVFENWPNGGNNLAITPELWDAMFTAVPSPAIGLCMDPSHLVWLGIDYLRATRDFRDRIYHAHAKDTEFLPEGSYRYGLYGAQLDVPAAGPWHWWRYRLPGYGVVNWPAFISTLSEIGYDGPLTIEHEDDVWGWLTDAERAKRGLVLARKFLENYVV